MAERICELVSTLLFFLKDMFDSIPIPMRFILESEPLSVKRRLQPRCGIDENNRVVDKIFFAQFSEEHLCERLGSRQK